MPRSSPRLESLTIPIVTERLHLEYPSLRRLDEYAPLLGDRAVSRWLLRVPYPYRRADAREHILRARRTRRNGTDLALAIVLRSSDRLIGGIGMHGIDWGHLHGEVGYWLGRPYWGAGYASEAVGALVDHAFMDLGFHRVEAGLFRGNSGSENVLRKAGFQPEGVRREAFFRDRVWQDDVLYGLTLDDWRQRRPVRATTSRRTPS